MADATKRLLDADRLVKSGVISTSPSASKVAMDSFINAGVSGLVSAPINVGAYAGSVATGEAIKSQYTPGTLPPPHLPGASTSPQAPVAVQTGAVAEVATTRRLDRVEAALLKFTNVLLTLTSGGAGDGIGKDENWPKERGARLTNLERLLDVSEQQLKVVAGDNGVLFKPYVVQQDVSGKSGGRVGEIEQRYRAMERAVDQIIILKGVETKRAGTSV
ncbi:hypothetical protein [Pseudomonas fluorescens]|uniref:hypothetical protein n=1 Tax=Pseudomonas fluorescens TaxID=294 RepID=UPI0020362A3B|nr:hypothetical protein [Pseudomonas fluorescens]